jgi:hypothetical protein
MNEQCVDTLSVCTKVLVSRTFLIVAPSGRRVSGIVSGTTVLSCHLTVFTKLFKITLYLKAVHNSIVRVYNPTIL